MLHEGRSVIYVARQLGHDARLTLTRYGHVIDELEDTPRDRCRGRDRGRAGVSGSEPGRARARIRIVTRAELHKLVDKLPDGAVEGAGVLLRGIIKGPVDPDQAWFWTPEWQGGEREADAELAEGSGVVYRSTDDFIVHLESVPPPESD